MKSPREKQLIRPAMTAMTPITIDDAELDFADIKMTARKQYEMDDQQVTNLLTKRYKTPKSVINEDPSQEMTQNMSLSLLQDQEPNKVINQQEMPESAEGDYSLFDYTVMGGKKKKKKKKKSRKLGDKS